MPPPAAPPGRVGAYVDLRAKARGVRRPVDELGVDAGGLALEIGFDIRM
ncbi:MAG: hypothetical protein M0Z95_16160 [Actinomycetota bacterium]|nr:hypothetical protein [Actinomycetota bacterium]